MKKTVHKMLPETCNTEIAIQEENSAPVFNLKFDHQHDLVYHSKFPSFFYENTLSVKSPSLLDRVIAFM